MNRQDKDITILGGGPAGLAAGYHAHKRGIPFTIYEQAKQWGGNCITYQWGDFRYDSGAHRIHGAEKEVMGDIFKLMGENISEVKRPSRIYTDGAFFTFPLELKNIISNMSLQDLAIGLKDFISLLHLKNGQIRNFEELAIRRYGKFFAKKFLLDYSEKLWGAPCSCLHPSLTGSRLNGLNLKNLMKEFIFKHARTRHMEGTFYYPKGGIGQLMNALAKKCGSENIHLHSKVTRILHDGRRIQAIELNNSEQIEVDEVVSTLPLNRLLEILHPSLEQEDLANYFKFRCLVLVAIFLDIPTVADAATLYFPDKRVPFTRIYEPRNRCALMSPPNKTSLVVEIPCDKDDSIWAYPEKRLMEIVFEDLCRTGWVKKKDMLGFDVQRIPYAYPVLKAGCESFLSKAYRLLQQISNLRYTGRNGRFSYSWIHDQFQWGRMILEDIDA